MKQAAKRILKVASLDESGENHSQVNYNWTIGSIMGQDVANSGSCYWHTHVEPSQFLYCQLYPPL